MAGSKKLTYSDIMEILQKLVDDIKDNKAAIEELRWRVLDLERGMRNGKNNN